MPTIYLSIVGPRPDPYPDPTARLMDWPSPGPMPRPRVLLIEDDGECAIVYGYAADGLFAGDNWYAGTDDAKAGMSRRYGRDLGPWQVVPQVDLNDAIEAALLQAAEP